MSRKRLTQLTMVLIIIAVVIITRPWYILDETEQAVILQLGKPIATIKESGLHLKLPYPLQVVYKFDKRLLEYDSPPEEVITEDKKTLLIDYYARWKIVDPLLFLQTVVSEARAMVRIDDIAYSELRTEVGKVELMDIVATERGQIMERVTAKTNLKAQDFGVEVVDVRIKRADLPSQNEEAVFQRMQTEREQQAKQYRSEGEEEATKVQAAADREKALILAEARREAQIIRGEGEAEALKIYAEAYNQDPEFFAFLRTMEMYEKSFTEKDTLILTPESEILNYLKSPRQSATRD